jgi:hypothetical protein
LHSRSNFHVANFLHELSLIIVEIAIVMVGGEARRNFAANVCSMPQVVEFQRASGPTRQRPNAPAADPTSGGSDYSR